MKKIIYAIAILVVILAGCSSNNNGVQPVSNNNGSQVEKANKTYKASNESKVYKIGTDIPVGEYYIETDPSLLTDNNYKTVGTIAVTTITIPESMEQISYIASIYSSVYITLNEEDGYLTLSNMTAYLANERPPVEKLDNGSYKPGSYKIGTDIKAGTYTLSYPKKVDGKENSTYYITSDDSHSAESIIDSSSLSIGNSKTVSVTDGQILDSGLLTITPS